MLFDDVYCGVPPSSPGVSSSLHPDLAWLSDVPSLPTPLPSVDDDLASGLGPWKNIASVVRQTMSGILRTQDRLSRENAALRSSVSSLSAQLAKISTAEDTSLAMRKLESSCAHRTDELAKTLREVRREVEMKADATYVTNCLLTKANKSEVGAAAARVEQMVVRMQAQTAANAQEKWEIGDAKNEKQRGVVQRQMVEARREIEEVKGRMEKVEEAVGKVGEMAKGREMQVQATVKGMAEAMLKEQIRMHAAEEVEEKLKGCREFQAVARQVEKVAAVQSSSQRALLEIETRLKETASKIDLKSGLSEKANKVSVASAIHKKANKADIGDAFEVLEGRVKTLEMALKGPQSLPIHTETPRSVRGPKLHAMRLSSSSDSEAPAGVEARPRSASSRKRKSSTRKLVFEVARLDEAIQGIENALLSQRALKGDMDSAMEALHRKLSRDIVALESQVESVKKNSSLAAAATIGSSPADVLEGRLRATTEVATESNNRSIVLKDQFVSLRTRVDSLEKDFFTLRGDWAQSRIELMELSSASARPKSSNFTTSQPMVPLSKKDPMQAENSENDRDVEEEAQVMRPDQSKDGGSPEVELPRKKSVARSYTREFLQRMHALHEIEGLEVQEPLASENSSGAKKKKKVKATEPRKKKVVKSSGGGAVAKHDCTASEQRRHLVKSKLEKQVAKLMKKEGASGRR